MDAHGGHAHRVLRGALRPAWSPDGTRLAAMGWFGGAGIIVVNADGTGRRVIVRPRGEDVVVGTPEWAPDGSAIAYVSSGSRADRLMVAPAGGGASRVVLRRPRAAGTIDQVDAWTETGILYDSGGLSLSVRRVQPDGTGDAELLQNAYGASFSPDGARVAFTVPRERPCPRDTCDVTGDIAVASADGSARRVIVSGPADDAWPSWSADGTTIAFASDRNTSRRFYGSDEVYSVRPDGSCLTWLTNSDRFTFDPAWGPTQGDASPGACGAMPRPPAIELRVGRGRGDALWLGHVFGRSLLSDIRHRGRYTEFDYSDCTSFRPCPAVRLEQYDACDPHGWLLPFRRVGRAGRALVLRHGRQSIALLGRNLVQTFDGTIGRRVIRGLRRVSGGQIGPRRLDAAFRGTLSPQARKLTQPC